MLLPARQAVENLAGVRAEDGIPLHTEPHGLAGASVTAVFAHGFVSDAQEIRFQRQAL